MKRIFILLCFVFVGLVNNSFADTGVVQWYNADLSSYETATCTIGGDIILPTPPTKPGYTFVGWTSLLPDGYTELEYVNMPAGSYLTTDIVPTSDMRIEMDFQTLGLGAGGCAWLGARDGSVGSGIAAGYTGTNALFFDGFTGTRYLPTTSAVANKYYKYTWNNGAAALTSGGTTVISNTFTPTGTTTNYLTINAMTSSGSVILNSAGIYLYSFKVWNGQGELVADYVPAVQKGTVPVVGMYDPVSGQFFTNSGTGDFIAGPVVQ